MYNVCTVNLIQYVIAYILLNVTPHSTSCIPRERELNCRGKNIHHLAKKSSKPFKHRNRQKGKNEKHYITGRGNI